MSEETRQGATSPSDGAAHVLDSRQAGGSFLRGGGLRLTAYAGGLIVGLAATPLVVHHLGPSRWGDYGKVVSLLFIVAAFTEGGLGQMGLRELSLADSESQRGFLRELLGLRLALTLVGVLMAVGFGLVAGWSRVVVTGIVIAGCGSLLTNAQGVLALPLAANLRFRWLAANDFVPQLASALLMIALVLSGAALMPFYFAPIAAGLSTIALTACAVRGEVSFLPRFRLSRSRALLAQTFVFAVATATGAAYFRIALIATSLISTSRQTGYFTLAFRILDLTASVPWLVVGSAFPILIRAAWNDSARLRYALQRLSEGSLILGGWFALCLVIGAPFAIHVLEGGGNRFAASIPVLRILGAAIAATFPLATFAYTMLSLKMYRQLIALNVAIIVLACSLAPLLISPLGAQGAALLSVILEVLLCAGYATALFRARPDLRPQAAGFRRSLLALAFAFGAAVPLVGLPIVGVLTGSAIFVLALLLLRAVPPELLEMLRVPSRR